MELMQRRREMLVMSSNALDTSPVVAEYGKRWDRGRYAKTDDATRGISIFYGYPAQTYTQTIVTMYLFSGDMCMIQKDGEYIDWWGQTGGSPGWDKGIELERTMINAGSNQISFTLVLDYLQTSYAYIKETGQILFAGKNTPYYGHRNISELN